MVFQPLVLFYQGQFLGGRLQEALSPPRQQDGGRQIGRYRHEGNGDAPVQSDGQRRAQHGFVRMLVADQRRQAPICKTPATRMADPALNTSFNRRICTAQCS